MVHSFVAGVMPSPPLLLNGSFLQKNPAIGVYITQLAKKMHAYRSYIYFVELWIYIFCTNFSFVNYTSRLFFFFFCPIGFCTFILIKTFFFSCSYLEAIYYFFIGFCTFILIKYELFFCMYLEAIFLFFSSGFCTFILIKTIFLYIPRPFLLFSSCFAPTFTLIK